MKKSLFIAVFTVFVFGCAETIQRTEPPLKYRYWKYLRVKENLNEQTGEINLIISDEKFTEIEREELIKILKELHKDFKVCTDGDILVSVLTVPDIESMSLIEMALENHVFKRQHKLDQVDTISN